MSQILVSPSTPGRGLKPPTYLQKFLPFSKTGELAVSNLRFRPISSAKACCGAGKQELECVTINTVITVLLLLILGSSLRANITDNEPQLKMDLLRIPGKESPFCVSSATQKGVFLL